MSDQPIHDQWQALYTAGDRVKAAAPWEWMTEGDVFGVQDPDTGEIGFVSVMGMLGEHYAVSVYLGAQALYDFLALEDAGPFGVAERLLEIPQLQASWEDREVLHAHDREMIKALGRKYRGRQAWPLFRSYQPGYAPWFITADEARMLTLALEQVPDVAQRFRDDPALQQPPNDEQFLVRVARDAGGERVWDDQLMIIPPPPPISIEVAMDAEALEQLAQVPPSIVTLEADLFMMLTPVRNDDGRLLYPYVLMLVDARNGMIVGSQLLTPEPSLQAMWGMVPVTFVYQLANSGLLPKQVQVQSSLLLHLLEPLTAELRFTLKHVPALPNLDMAKDMLFQTLL